MDLFTHLVEKFYKQTNTCFGVDPNIRGRWKRKKVEGHPHRRIDFDSPILPLDLTPEEKQAMGSQWQHIPLDYGRTQLMEELGVDPTYKHNQQIIKIKKTMKKEDLDTPEALLIVEDCKQQHWERKQPVFHPIILEDLEKYIEKWKEDPRFSDATEVEAFNVYMDVEVRINLLRADYEQRLIRAIKGLSLDYTELDQFSQTVDDAKKYKTISESVADEEDEPFEPVKVMRMKKSFINKFDNNSFSDIYDHFSKNLVPKHISKENLEEYIRAAFHHQNKSNSFTFDYFDKKKGHIQDVWVQYYKKSHDSHANKELFIPLLGDYFKEFDTKKMLADYAKGNTNFK
jgi:hypothetical protein